MYTSTLTLLTSLAALTTSQAIPAGYTWTVTGWSAGCARRGCYYDFNISGPALPTTSYNIPAFSAYCSGDDKQAFRQCNVTDAVEGQFVSARLPERNETEINPTVFVSYQFAGEYPESFRNFTGSNGTAPRFNQFVSPALTFEVTPDAAWGVA